MPNYVTNEISIHANKKQMTDILESIRRDGDALGSFDFNKIIPMPESLNVVDGSITSDAINAFLSDSYQRATDSEASGNHFQELSKYLTAAHQIRFVQIGPNESGEWIQNTAKRYDMSPSDFLSLGKQYLDNQLQYGAHTWYTWRVKNWGTKWNTPEGTLLRDNNTLHFDTAWSAPNEIMTALSGKYPGIRFDHKWADEDLGQNVGQCSYISGRVVDAHIPPSGSKEAFDLAFSILHSSPEQHFLRYDAEQGTYVFDAQMEESFFASLDDQIQTARDKQMQQADSNQETSKKEKVAEEVEH